MESYQISVKNALKKLFPLVELMKDGRCWERLMEVEADVCLHYLVLTDVEW